MFYREGEMKFCSSFTGIMTCMCSGLKIAPTCMLASKGIQSTTFKSYSVQFNSTSYNLMYWRMCHCRKLFIWCPCQVIF